MVDVGRSIHQLPARSYAITSSVVPTLPTRSRTFTAAPRAAACGVPLPDPGG